MSLTEIIPNPSFLDAVSLPGAKVAFDGATAAENISGSAVRVRWDEPEGASGSVAGYRVYENVSGVWTPIGQVLQGNSSFIQTGLTSGTVHEYRVRLVDLLGVEDKNEVTVSATTYEGATAASPLAATTATLHFEAAPWAAQLKVSCRTRTESETLIASPAPTATSLPLTGLIGATTYRCRVNAVNANGLLDSNESVVTFQTSGTIAGNYNHVALVTAYGDAPTAPTPQPRARQVSITWRAFTGATGATQYRLLRVGVGHDLEVPVGTPAACTSTVESTCMVSCAGLLGTGAKSCTDTNVARSPQRYDYYVVKEAAGGYLEEPPLENQSSYAIRVEVPPPNMVLVHRDSANYEMCTGMGKSPDPLNHQRCAYTGLGATAVSANPTSTPLALASGYYDFGYNLFVDRFESACAWTSGPGVCTVNGTSGHCYATSADPAAGDGVDGSVFYRVDTGTCFVKSGSSWLALNSASLSESYRRAALSNSPLCDWSTEESSGKCGASATSGDCFGASDPGAGIGLNGNRYFNSSTRVCWEKSNGSWAAVGTSNQKTLRPPLAQISQSVAWDQCRAASVGTYGSKRLMRKREFVAAAAWSRTGLDDPNTQSSATLTTLENGTSLNTTYACNSNSSNGVAGFGAGTFNSTTHDQALNSLGTLVVGSPFSASCVSRFGLSDAVGNVNEWVSDQLGACVGGATNTCLGQASSLDSGNRDLETYAFDGTQGPGNMATAVSNWVLGTPPGWSSDPTYFSVPMAMPFLNSSGHANSSSALQIGVGILATRLNSDRMRVDSTSAGSSRGLIVGGGSSSAGDAGVYYAAFDQVPTYTSATVGFRCAVGVE